MTTHHDTGVQLLRFGIVSTAVLAALMIVTPLPSHLFSWIALGDWTSFATEGRTGDYVSFSHAVTGAVMVGWMVCLWWMVGQVRDRVPGAWRATALSIGGWFVLDSSTSIARGYPANAALNTVMALVLVLGLWLTRTARHAPTAADGSRAY